MVETEPKEVGAGVPEDVKKMDVDLEVTNKDFEEVKDEDGKVLFSCVHCPYKNPTVANTKKHITACHVKPKTAKRSTTDPADHDVKRKKDKKFSAKSWERTTPNEDRFTCAEIFLPAAACLFNVFERLSDTREGCSQRSIVVAAAPLGP